ncbi:MAG: hypothetical protein QM811_09720 [Pirellulales bacterium]
MTLRSAALCIAFLATLSSVVAAETALSRAQLDQFFDLGWKPSIANHGHVQKEYAQLSAAAPRDPLLEQAYFLLLVRQRKYDAALDQSIAALRVAPNDPWLLRGRIWTLTLTKQYAAALVEMEALAAALADPATKLSADDAREAANFLGRVYAYIDGPVGNDTKKQTRDSTREKIVAKLGPERAAAFRDGIVVTAEKFAGLCKTSSKPKPERFRWRPKRKSKRKSNWPRRKET